jgi:hypothetical protein
MGRSSSARGELTFFREKLRKMRKIIKYYIIKPKRMKGKKGKETRRDDVPWSNPSRLELRTCSFFLSFLLSLFFLCFALLWGAVFVYLVWYGGIELQKQKQNLPSRVASAADIQCICCCSQQLSVDYVIDGVFRVFKNRLKYDLKSNQIICRKYDLKLQSNRHFLR